jgi:hypothetical protein
MERDVLMEPGDRFIADECGCSFSVTSGPRDESQAHEAPRCCCGHQMRKDTAPPPPD